MTHTSAHIRTVSGTSMAAGWAGQHALTIDRPNENGGSGLGHTGGELLLLAVGACFYNDLLREAAARAIVVRHVQIEVHADWGGDPPRAQQISYSAAVEADASESAILDLIRHADRVAEIPNTVRLSADVTLRDARAATSAPQPAAGEAEQPQADAVLEMLGAAEAGGSTCALLTPAIRARLRELAGGQVLEVRVDDTSAREDIASWCRLSGHELLAVVDEMPKYTRYFLRKKRS